MIRTSFVFLILTTIFISTEAIAAQSAIERAAELYKIASPVTKSEISRNMFWAGLRVASHDLSPRSGFIAMFPANSDEDPLLKDSVFVMNRYRVSDNDTPNYYLNLSEKDSLKEYELNEQYLRAESWTPVGRVCTNCSIAEMTFTYGPRQEIQGAIRKITYKGVFMYLVPNWCMNYYGCRYSDRFVGYQQVIDITYAWKQKLKVSGDSNENSSSNIPEPFPETFDDPLYMK